MEFIRVTEIKYKDELLININNISVIHIPSKSILVNGTSGEQNGWYCFDEENFNKIINYLKDNDLQQQLSKQEKIIDTILNYPLFENDCPFSVSGEELSCCKDCKDDYKSCWLKYIEKKLEE